MFDDRLLNELIIEQELLKDTSLLLKKKESLNKSLFLSLNETNDNLNKIFLNILQRQDQLLNYLCEEKDRCNQRQIFENLLNQILHNEKLIIEKLKRIYLKLNKKKKKQEKYFISSTKLEQSKILVNHQINTENDKHSFRTESKSSNEQILKIYWRSSSSKNKLHKTNSFAMKKTSTDINK